MENILICTNCDVHCKNKRDYNAHILTKKHLKNINRCTEEYNCKLCNTTIKTKRDQELHNQTTKHMNNILGIVNNYNCDTCNILLVNKRDYNRHQQTTKHKNNMLSIEKQYISIYECPYCNKYETSVKANCEKHIKNTHQEVNSSVASCTSARYAGLAGYLKNTMEYKLTNRYIDYYNSISKRPPITHATLNNELKELSKLRNESVSYYKAIIDKTNITLEIIKKKVLITDLKKNSKSAEENSDNEVEYIEDECINDINEGNNDFKDKLDDECIKTIEKIEILIKEGYGSKEKLDKIISVYTDRFDNLDIYLLDLEDEQDKKCRQG